MVTAALFQNDGGVSGEEDADEGIKSLHWEVVPDRKGHGWKKSQKG